MQSPYKYYSPLLLFIVATGFLIWGLEWRKQESSEWVNRTLEGQPFPSFSLPSLDDSVLLSNQHLPEQPYLVNIWASWCPSCYVEHEFLNQLAEQKIPIIGINYKDDKAKAERYLNQLGNPYQLIIVDQHGSLAVDLGVTGAPETYLVGGKGIIHYKHQGVVNNDVWNDKISPIYNQLLNDTKP